MIIRRILYVIIYVSILGYFYTSAAKDRSPDTKNRVNKTVSHFRIKDQLPEWREIENTYAEFNPKGLYDIIDGGADIYIEQGLKQGIFQSLKTAQDYRCDIFAEDFGSAENALNMYTEMKESISESIPIRDFKKKNILAEEVIGGVTVYMCEAHYYFELSLSGFDTREQALEKAVAIVRYLYTIINSH